MASPLSYYIMGQEVLLNFSRKLNFVTLVFANKIFREFREFRDLPSQDISRIPLYKDFHKRKFNYHIWTAVTLAKKAKVTARRNCSHFVTKKCQFLRKKYHFLSLQTKFGVILNIWSDFMTSYTKIQIWISIFDFN